MSDFTIVISNRNPKILKPLLDKAYSPYLTEPACFVHNLILYHWGVIAEIKGKEQSLQYSASIKETPVCNIFNESLVLFNEMHSSICLISIASESHSQAKETTQQTIKEVSYDATWTTLSVTNTLMGTHNYNVCMPGQNEMLCKLLLLVIDGLKDTHQFNVYVTENVSLIFKAVSIFDRTIVEIKTNSWLGVSIDQFNSEIFNDEQFRRKIIH